MKGIELPINILVIVAVAIIVLLGVIALFYSSWFSSTQPVGLQSAVAQCCNSITRTGNCSLTNADLANVPCNYGAALNLSSVCTVYYHTVTAIQCLKQVCGMTQCGV